MRLAVVLESERAGLVQTIDLRLAETSTEGATDEPLQLHPAHGAHAHEVAEASLELAGAHTQALEIRGLQQTSIARREGLPERAKPLARMFLGRARNVGGDIAVGVAQAYEQEERWLGGADRLDVAGVLARVDPVGARVGRRAESVDLAQVGIEIPGAGDAEYLNVGFERLERAHQAREPRALGLVGEPLIRGAGNRERGPRVIQGGPEDDAAVNE